MDAFQKKLPILRAMRPAQWVKNALVAAPLFFATLSYGYDFSPNDRLALGTPFRDIEQVFSECKEAYVITNELGDVAAMHGDLDKVKSLLQKGADVVETDKTGFTLIDILREYLRRIEAIQPEAKADYADKLEQSGFLEKDVRRLLRIADEATRDLPKEKSQIEALKQILTFIETSISHKFEVQYCAWKKWVANHPLASTYTTNEPFFAIVNLGVSAIPLIVEKNETNKDDFHLGSAIGLIAKRKFGRDEWPEGKLGDSIAASEMYVKWWKYGRHKTEMRFEELLSEWDHSVTKGNAHKTQEILREISDLGIPVLPYLVVQLNENPELIPVFLYLSEAPLELPASAKDCVQWWNENKANYEVLWRVCRQQN